MWIREAAMHSFHARAPRARRDLGGDLDAPDGVSAAAALYTSGLPGGTGPSTTLPVVSGFLLEFVANWLIAVN